MSDDRRRGPEDEGDSHGGSDARPEEQADKEAILARRRRFITIALAGAGVAAAGCDEPKPAVCLEPQIPDSEPPPTVDVPPPEPDDAEDAQPSPDAGTEEGDEEVGDEEVGDEEVGDEEDATAADDGKGDAPPSPPKPRPCLEQLDPPPRLRVCLKVAAPPDLDDETK